MLSMDQSPVTSKTLLLVVTLLAWGDPLLDKKQHLHIYIIYLHTHTHTPEK